MTALWRAYRLALLTLLVALLALPAGAAAHVTLHFRALAGSSAAEGLTSSGPYVGFTLDPVPGRRSSSTFVVIDDRTGQRTVLRPCRGKRGLFVGVLGGGRVGFDCDTKPRFVLYEIARARWSTLACDDACAANYYLVGIAGLGAHWLALGVAPHQSCGDGIHNSCGSETYLFYNVATGRRAVPRLRGDQIIDLDSANLVHHLCRPLQVPAALPAFPSPVMFYGGFAVAEQTDGIDLERCGTRLHVPLVRSPFAGTIVGNQQAVGFCSSAAPAGEGSIDGVSLPKLRRFTAAIPSGFGCGALGPRHLYSPGGHGGIWAAPFPSAR